MRLFIIGLLSLSLFGCGDPPPKHQCKYTIFIGSAAVAVGYGTHAYEEKDGKITFVKCNSHGAGTKVIVYTTAIYKIMENY